MKNLLFACTLCLIGLNGFSQNIGYDETSPGSKISIHENLSVGSNYSSLAAPASGAIIQGSVGIGTSAPVSALDVSGGLSIGTYAGTNAAPTNGVIVSGSFGIGTTSPTSALSVGSSSQFQVNSTGNIVKINNVTTSFPSSQGTAGTVLTNDGSGNLSWAASGSGTVGKSYALVSAATNDPNATISGGPYTYTEVGEVTVVVNSGDVLITDAYFTAYTTTNQTITRVTRSQTAGSGSVGTVVAYSACNFSGASKFHTTSVVSREAGLTAGTWYYKLWSTQYNAGTENYTMVITKAQ